MLHTGDRPSFAQVLAKLRLVELRLPNDLARLPLERGLEALAEAEEGQNQVHLCERFCIAVSPLSRCLLSARM